MGEGNVPAGMGNPAAGYGYNYGQQQQQYGSWGGNYEQQTADPVSSETTAEPEASEESPSLPPGWSEHVDPTSGNTYYFNSNDGTTTWDRPGSDTTSEEGSGKEAEDPETEQSTLEKEPNAQQEQESINTDGGNDSTAPEGTNANDAQAEYATTQDSAR